MMIVSIDLFSYKQEGIFYTFKDIRMVVERDHLPS